MSYHQRQGQGSDLTGMGNHPSFEGHEDWIRGTMGSQGAAALAGDSGRATGARCSEGTDMGTQFNEMAAMFVDLVEAVSKGREVSIETELAHPELTVVDGHGKQVLRVVLFDYPQGERGHDLPFIYGTQMSNGVEVLPVALPGDAISTLTRIKNMF